MSSQRQPLTEEERAMRAPCRCGGTIRVTKAWTAWSTSVVLRDFRLNELNCTRCGHWLGNTPTFQTKRGRGGRRKRVQRRAGGAS